MIKHLNINNIFIVLLLAYYFRMHFGLATSRIVAILISAAFRSEALIKRETLKRGRRLF